MPFQIQVLEVDELDTTQIQPKKQGNKVVGGIEYNRWNRPEGYWIRQYSVDGYTLMKPVYLEAKDVIFYYSRKRPSQAREMSDLSPTLTRIKDMNEFMTAVTIKEKIAACLAVFIKRVNPSGPPGKGREARNGPSVQYEGKSTAIQDCKICSESPGEVDIYVMLKNGELPNETFLEGVSDFLAKDNKRPLTDKVVMKAPTAEEYSIDVTYYINQSDQDMAEAIKQKAETACQRFVSWQQAAIARDSCGYVKTLQQLLSARGYNTNGVDGIFGSGTEAAVAQFQASSGVKVNYPGTVGAKTWAALLKG